MGFEFASDQRSKIRIAGYNEVIDHSQARLRERIAIQLSDDLEVGGEAAIRAIEVAKEIGFPLRQAALESLANAAQSEAADAALAQLISQRAPGAIERGVERLITDHTSSATGKGRIALALEEVWPLVNREDANAMAGSAEGTVRKAGLRMLQHLATEADVPRLMLALNTGTRAEQYSAVIALNRMAGRIGPSVRDFADNPHTEVAYWNSTFPGFDNAPRVVEKMEPEASPSTVESVASRKQEPRSEGTQGLPNYVYLLGLLFVMSGLAWIVRTRKRV